MADYVLVHGGDLSTDTWNKLVKREEYPPRQHLGAKVWDNVAMALRQKYHRVFAPDLLDENDFNLSDHIGQICALIEENRLKNISLIGASYGGMVITGVASKMPDNIALLVYLDAAYPKVGQSLYDILLEGDYDPSPVLEKFPKAYTEKIRFDPAKLTALSKIYIQCMDSSFLSVTRLAADRISKEKNWKIFKLPTSHVPQATMPDKLIELFLKFSKEL